jgi:hypothetical protein
MLMYPYRPREDNNWEVSREHRTKIHGKRDYKLSNAEWQLIMTTNNDIGPEFDCKWPRYIRT